MITLKVLTTIALGTKKEVKSMIEDDSELDKDCAKQTILDVMKNLLTLLPSSKD